jgi:asparagine synthase (glutamine-hydrolysing)
MCGIAGIITKDGTVPERTALEAMRDALSHRGPDGADIYVAGRVGLVHTRLAIIDLTTGDQPLYGPDGAVMVANGEIYNYVELDAGLAPDAPRRTKSDLEPFLHLAAQSQREGTDGLSDALDALRGMYALALHRPGTDGVWLARDQFGIKPLYVCETDSLLAFASEPRALIAAGYVSPALCPDGLRELVELGHTPKRRTVYAGIRRLSAGEITQTNGTETVQLVTEEFDPPADMDAAVAQFDTLFEESVRIHQRADVPYGLFLSGGLDSAAVLTMMARLNDRPVRTFTCGFDGGDVHDERPAARQVSDMLGAEHTEVAFSEEEFWDLLPQVAWALDDPAVDYAILPTWKLGQAANKVGLKVVLSGEGGDEVFAGYGRYRYLQRPWWRGGRKPRVRGRLARLALTKHLGGQWRAPVAAAQRHAMRSARTPLQGAQRWDLEGWLVDDLLLKLDRCLMAHGVEGRVPFVDRKMVAFGLGLPDHLKVAGDQGKMVLRHWLHQNCPAADAFGRKKGFTVPVGPWISRNSQVGKLVAAQPAVRSLCASEDVERLFADCAGGHAAMAAWTLLFLAVWHQIHIEGADPQQGAMDILRF